MPEHSSSAGPQLHCVFAHGWAYTLEFFSPLLKALLVEHPALMASFQVFGLEQGYFERPAGVYQWTGTDWVRSTLPSALPPALGIGHSLGLAKLLTLPSPCAHLLSLNGFTRFTAQERGQTGTPKRLVERMLSKLHQAPEVVVQDFWARAEHTEGASTCGSRKEGPVHLTPLIDDLQSMIDLDLSSSLQNMPSKQLLSVWSKEDQIVSAELSAQTFPADCLQEVNAPHSGPLVLPKVYTHVVAQALTNALGAFANPLHAEPIKT